CGLGDDDELAASVGIPMQLILRRANVFRLSGPWSEDDYDVFEGDRDVGRIYRVTDRPNSEWFWGVSFDLILTGEKAERRRARRPWQPLPSIWNGAPKEP